MGFKQWFTKDRGDIDRGLLAIIIVLILCGLLILFSASYYYGQHNFGDGYYYVKRQLRGILMGSILMVFFAKVNYRVFSSTKMIITVYVVSVVLLVACFLPGIGMNVNGASRWIRLPGTTFQPSEFAKFGLIITLAGLIAKYRQDAIKNSFFAIAVPILLIGGIAVLLLKQPNFSVMAVTVISAFLLLILAGMRWSHIVLIGVVGLLVGLVLLVGAEYRVKRLIFWNPFGDDVDPDSAYQLRQALYAIGSGGIFGQGLGGSKQKFLFLPYSESDFIFAIIAEEFGLVGCIVLIIAYLFLLWRGYLVAMKCKDTFGRLAAGGITTLIGVQTFVCIAVSCGAMPTTGVPLPFISYGSSSMMCFMAACGVLLSISRKPAVTAVKAKPKPRQQRLRAVADRSA